MHGSGQERWLTYDEVGHLFGITPAAARMLSKRRGWQRRTPNAYGDRARVLVPADAIVQPRSASIGEHTAYAVAHDQEEANGHDQVNVQVIEQAIATLQEQLTVANARAEKAEQRADAERARVNGAERRIDELLTALADARGAELRVALADAVAAERIAAGEAAAFRTEADRRSNWGMLRRWRWALRGR